MKNEFVVTLLQFIEGTDILPTVKVLVTSTVCRCQGFGSESAAGEPWLGSGDKEE